MLHRGNNLYFWWLCSRVCGCGNNSTATKYADLLVYLHGRTFKYFIENDGNRVEDAYDLRNQFEDEHNEHIDLDRPSVLEVLAALAIRCEEDIMHDDEFGDRTPVWFMIMLSNIGLSHMINERFNQKEADKVIDVFLNREYDRNGRNGGAFQITDPDVNMRNTELWYQMHKYIHENY